jgi:polar amino acid transport system substrate-binding protein
LQLLHGYVTKDSAAYALVGNPVPFGEGKGIVLRKGETDLAARMTEALAAIVANGEHAKISTTYFGQPLAITN